MSRSRKYTTRRSSIVESLVTLFKTIDGSGSFVSNLSGNVYNHLKYISNINDFPSVCVVAGSESRDYQAGQYRDRYLSIRLIIFLNEENPLTKLDAVLEDIETLIEDNGRLAYTDKLGNIDTTHDITVLSISTDEGTLEPIAIGEMSLRVHY